MTLEQLQARLDAYIAAEAAILRRQEYTIGSGSTSRKVVFADLAEVRSAIRDLTSQVAAAQPSALRPRRLIQLRPR